MAGTIVYKVKAGDSLANFGVPLAEILRLNPGLKSVKAGMTIKLPVTKTGVGANPAYAGKPQPGGGGMIPGQVTSGKPGTLPPPSTNPIKPGQITTPPPMRDQYGGRTMGGGGNPNMPTFNTGGALPPYKPGTSGGKPIQGQVQAGGGGMIPGQTPVGGKPVQGPNTISGVSSGWAGGGGNPNKKNDGFQQLSGLFQQLAVQNPTLTQNPAFAQIMQLLGSQGEQQPVAGVAPVDNTGDPMQQLLTLLQQMLGGGGGVQGGNNAVNQGMNWRF